MKLITCTLVITIVLSQYRIWIDKRGWHDFSSIEKQLTQLEELSRRLQIRNNAIKAEINDLKNGQNAIVEASRKNLGFIHKGEIYYQIVP